MKIIKLIQDHIYPQDMTSCRIHYPNILDGIPAMTVFNFGENRVVFSYAWSADLCHMSVSVYIHKADFTETQYFDTPDEQLVFYEVLEIISNMAEESRSVEVSDVICSGKTTSDY